MDSGLSPMFTRTGFGVEQALREAAQQVDRPSCVTLHKPLASLNSCFPGPRSWGSAPKPRCSLLRWSPVLAEEQELSVPNPTPPLSTAGPELWSLGTEGQSLSKPPGLTELPPGTAVLVVRAWSGSWGEETRAWLCLWVLPLLQLAEGSWRAGSPPGRHQQGWLCPEPSPWPPGCSWAGAILRTQRTAAEGIRIQGHP